MKFRLVASLRNGGAILDVGCGTGEFLEYLQKKGVAIAGVEPNDNARIKAEQRLGIKLAAELQDLRPDQSFQLISLWHVLEHVPDPHGTVARLADHLEAGGHLIIAVPTRDSWDSRHYGPFWAAWDVPRHLSHFRKADIVRLLNDHGFSLTATRSMWLDSFYICLLSERYAGSGQIGAWIKGLLFGAWSDLQAALGSRPTSSTLFIARKSR